LVGTRHRFAKSALLYR